MTQHLQSQSVQRPPYFSEQVRRRFQRSKHYVDGLRSRPWWPREEFKIVHALELNYPDIKQEFIDLVLTGRLKQHPQSPGGPRKAIATGEWKIFELLSSGRKNAENAFEAPTTSRVLEEFEEDTRLPNGLAYFSVVAGGGRVLPHCGPTNTRLRIHLGISVPPEAWLRVGPEVHRWKEGECLIFDDSWEHEVGNESLRNRGVLIVDIWHPDLSDESRKKMVAKRPLKPSNKNLQRGGWIKLK